MSEECSIHFFQITLPAIINLALQLPDLMCTAIPLLRQGATRSVSLSQQQIATLLANAFLCTFPRRNSKHYKMEYKFFPDINFNRLYQSVEPQVLEKIKCIIHYFQRVTSTGDLF